MYLLDQAHWSLLAALKEHGTLSTAAAVLGVTQSAATQRLREAERRLGVPLAQKQGRTLMLTDAGRTIAAAAQATQPALRQAESEAIWQGKRSSHRLKLCWGHFDPARLALRLGDICRRADPAMSLEVTRVKGEDVTAAVTSGEADLAVVPGPVRMGEQASRRLLRDRLVAVFPASMTPEEPVAPAAFAALPFLTFGLRPEPGWEYDLFFGRGRSFPGEAVRIESTELICQLVAEKAGASILPRLSVAMSACSDRVAVAELDVEPISFDWHLLHGGETAPGLLDRIEQDSDGWLETAL